MLKSVRTIMASTSVVPLLSSLMIALVLPLTVPASDDELLSISIPQSSLVLHDRERVAGFEVNISGGEIISFPRVPSGWGICIYNEANGRARIGGNATIGSAILKTSFFENFITIKKYDDKEPPRINIKIGTLAQVTLEERLILLEMKDLVFKKIE